MKLLTVIKCVTFDLTNIEYISMQLVCALKKYTHFKINWINIY